MTPRSHAFLALVAIVVAPVSAAAAPGRPRPETSFADRLESALGRGEVAVAGATVVGRLLEPARECPLRVAEEELRGTALDDSVAGVPEAMNGAGVTCRRRNDLPAALEWYKKALGVDADLGDAHHEDMACVYAIQGDGELALRYLQIAALNGYAGAEGIEADPDLAGLREEPACRSLVRARL